jgi:hypothetical protein
MNKNMTTKPQDQRDIEAREALKPCPFCGGTDIEIANTHTPKFWVECNGCEAEARGEYFEGQPAESHFHYDQMPNSDFDGDYEQLPENYKAAFRSAIAAWNARPAPEALLWQIMVAGPAGYVRREAFAGSNLAEALKNVRKQGFAWVEDEDSGFPDVLVKMAAPEALGAAIPGDVETAVRMVFESTNETQYTPLCKYWFRKGYGYGLEALGAAKGVELSDDDAYAAWSEVAPYGAGLEPEVIVAFARAVLAKANGA